MTYNCSICFNDIFFPNKLSCGHIFHLSCIDKWQRIGKDTCPCCRANIDITLVPSNGIHIRPIDIDNAKKFSNLS